MFHLLFFFTSYSIIIKKKQKNIHQSKIQNYNKYLFIYSSHIIETQLEMAERCIEILAIPEGKECLI